MRVDRCEFILGKNLMVEIIKGDTTKPVVSVKTGDNVDINGLLLISGLSLLGISIQYYCKAHRGH